MTTARELMCPDVVCAHAGDTLVEAARTMAAAGTGALPVCGANGTLTGMLTGRRIVVKAVAQQKNPSSTRVSELAQNAPVVVQVDEDVTAALTAMAERRVSRVPVLDGRTLVGILTQADLARALRSDTDGRVVGEISEDRP